MAVMSAEKAATKVRSVSESDIQSGVTQIKDVRAVKGWIGRGMPDRDIEMEASNVIRDRVDNPDYKAMKNRICTKYRIDEQELVRQLLWHIASS